MTHIMGRLRTLAMATAAAGACIFTLLPEEAMASRRASVAENRLILDRNDVYLFPQLGTEYANLIALDYGASASSGSGLLIFGDELRALGVGVYRGDLRHSNLLFPNLAHPNLDGPDSPLGIFEYPSPVTAIDLFGSLDLDGARAGARIALGNGGNTVTNLENKKTGATQTFVNATLGYSLFGDLRLDGALNLGFATAKSVVNDVDQTSGTGFSIGATARGYSALAGDLQVGFLADLNFDSASSTIIADPDVAESVDITSKHTSFSLGAGVGPIYELEDRATLGAYGIVGIRRNSHDPDTRSADVAQNDRTFDNAFVLPGVHVAADIKILKWLYFRSGMQYSFVINSTKTEQDTTGNDDAVRDNIVRTDRDDAFAWRAGVGIVLGDFTLDGTFQQGFLLNGPDFLSGAGTGLFSMVSMTYSF